MEIRIAEARVRTEVIEEPAKKWSSNVEKLLGEVEVLIQRKETGFNCCQGWLPMRRRYRLCKQMVKKIEEMGTFIGK
ncbi:disease resistance protein (CC-NBS-LRR class) family protein, partial [Trifolium medium]|nr:disease resistance protein (CC-NBS-LRR class) family protein [Trifolium medium]